jgi:predicted Zn-dependent protease
MTLVVPAATGFNVQAWSNRRICGNSEDMTIGTQPARMEMMEHAPETAIKAAQNLADKGQFSEAAQEFESLFEAFPGDPQALEALADIMHEIGQTESSLALLADSVDASKPDPKLLLRIADQLAGVGRLEESADFLLCALCGAPDDAMLRLRTETLIQSLGRTEQLEWLRSGMDGDMPSA